MIILNIISDYIERARESSVPAPLADMLVSVTIDLMNTRGNEYSKRCLHGVTILAGLEAARRINKWALDPANSETRNDAVEASGRLVRLLPYIDALPQNIAKRLHATIALTMKELSDNEVKRRAMLQ